MWVRLYGGFIGPKTWNVLYMSATYTRVYMVCIIDLYTKITLFEVVAQPSIGNLFAAAKDPSTQKALNNTEGMANYRGFVNFMHDLLQDIAARTNDVNENSSGVGFDARLPALCPSTGKMHILIWCMRIECSDLYFSGSEQVSNARQRNNVLHYKIENVNKYYALKQIHILKLKT